MRKTYKNIDKVVRLLRNDLEQIVIKKISRIQGIKEELGKLGARGALMSGSGPTVFGLFKDEGSAARAREGLKLGKRDKIFLVRGL